MSNRFIIQTVYHIFKLLDSKTLLSSPSPIMFRTVCLLTALTCIQSVTAQDSLEPYKVDSVPQSVTDLWKDVDFRKDPLETQIVKEWKEDGIVCRYVIFKIGTFKGAESRCAAFYTFPEGMKKGPAFVWAHGGGQRADRTRGTYFAKQGFASIDINWGGREMVQGIQPNTDWGKVDPSQGPQFYPGALRPRVKLNLLPDEHTLDPVVSPRNGIWYLLSYAGRRAVTFLEQQPEVDPDRIGFTGYSMGGNITSMVAIDERLKAVAPMVGGSGFIMEDFPGIPNTGRARSFKNVDLYNRTIDAQSYWPLVKCPVLFLNASDDFHAVFDNVYKSASLIPHDNWLASHLMHYNHSLGSEQWILLKLWFDRYLKGDAVEFPQTVKPQFEIVKSKDQASAKFSVEPDRIQDVAKLNIFYSHDPNARARFWIQATANKTGNQWSTELPVRKNLPLYAFANITYKLAKPSLSFSGMTETYSITSDESVYLPKKVDESLLRSQAEHIPLFADFDQNGIRDWAATPQGGLSTYKFQDPKRKTPGPEYSLRVTINVPRKKLSFRFRASKGQFLTGNAGTKGTYFVNRNPKIGDGQQIVLRPGDFVERNKGPMSDWSGISTFRFDVYDGEARRMLDFKDPKNVKLISKMEWIKAKSP